MTETTTPRRVNAGPRPIKDIVADITTTWGAEKVRTTGYAAKPYLEALSQVESVDEVYGDEKAEHLVRYLLSNLAQFKGAQARVLKEELRAHLPGRR